MKIIHNPDPAPLRAAAYMELGDQLDALMKGLAALHAQGIQLPPETVAWIEHCQDVKARFQKR
jgi:hypothetical protein